MYKTRQWRQGEIAQYFPQHIYIRPQPCTIQEVDPSGWVKKIFFHERRIMRGCEDWGVNEKLLKRGEERFLQEYIKPTLTSDDIEETIESYY